MSRLDAILSELEDRHDLLESERVWWVEVR